MASFACLELDLTVYPQAFNIHAASIGEIKCLSRSYSSCSKVLPMPRFL